MRDRWAEGLPHHPFSVSVVQAIKDIDENDGNLYFDFRTGGDGDNGETLMFWLDEWIEQHGKCPCCRKEASDD